MPDASDALTDAVPVFAAAPAAPVPGHAPRVLVVDDHPDILEPLAEYLESQGLAVLTALDGRRMREILTREGAAVDLVVLDVMLPDESGWTLCEVAVREHRLPVIMLTAMVEVQDRVRGLALGADDYVVKPFAPAELLARIHTVLRRARRPVAEPSAAGQPFATPAPVQAGAQDAQDAPGADDALAPSGEAVACYGFEGWTLDLRRYELRDPAGKAVNLNSAELKLLRALVTHPNTVLSRDTLLQLTHGPQTPSVFDRSIDTAVSRLRRKLEARTGGQRLIKTAWGDGYLFAAEVRAEP